MSSTLFTSAVTTIPTAWANDVNRVIYDVLGAPSSLSQLQMALGLGPVLNGGAFQVINGRIDGTPIGANQPSTALFTRAQITGNYSSLNDVVTHGQLISAVNGAVNAIESMAYQNAGGVDITGGTIDGCAIGNAVPGPGRFTTLRASDPVSGSDVVNIQTLDARLSTLPSFGTMASQNAVSVNIDGGLIDNTTIGSVTPAEGWFTRINANRILGSTVQAWMDGSAPGAGRYALLFDLLSNSALDLGFRLKAGAAVVFDSPSGTMTYADGRLSVNTIDDGIHDVQVGGDLRALNLVVGNTLPTAGNHATSKNYVDTRDMVVAASIAPAIAAAVASLGTIVTQSASAINLTGGAIDGVVIGGLNPDIGSFTQVNSNLYVGSHGTIRLDGTGGFANSGAAISAANASRPNISVVPNALGSFAVMAGATPILRTHVNGRTIVGVGGDDGLNTLQVYGDAVVHGRLTLDGGVVTGTVTPVLGTTAPALAGGGVPLWARIRVETITGPVECVVPAFPVL